MIIRHTDDPWFVTRYLLTSKAPDLPSELTTENPWYPGLEGLATYAASGPTNHSYVTLQRDSERLASGSSSNPRECFGHGETTEAETTEAERVRTKNGERRGDARVVRRGWVAG